MISTIADLDHATAAGILARTAISFSDEYNPSAPYILSDEKQRRAGILREITEQLGIRGESYSEDDLEKINARFEEELDALAPPVDMQAQLKKLSESGDLPSDLYIISVIENVINLYGDKWSEELKHIEDAVHKCDTQQHFTKATSGPALHLISLFGKWIKHPEYPNRSFLMLVGGQRTGQILNVHQAWRIYPDRVNLDGAKDLLDIFRRFANEFGVPFRLNNREESTFVVELEQKAGTFNTIDMTFVPENSKNKKLVRRPEIMISHFTTPNGDSKSAALVIAVNLDKYRRTLTAHGW